MRSNSYLIMRRSSSSSRRLWKSTTRRRFQALWNGTLAVISVKLKLTASRKLKTRPTPMISWFQLITDILKGVQVQDKPKTITILRVGKSGCLSSTARTCSLMTLLPTNTKTMKERFVVSNATIRCFKTMRIGSARNSKTGCKENRHAIKQSSGRVSEPNSVKKKDKGTLWKIESTTK